MQYYQYKFQAQNVEAKVSEFKLQSGGVAEYSAILTGNAIDETFSQQTARITEALQLLANELSAVPVFVRQFLSDPANQDTQKLLWGCPVSTIGQCPLNGSKIAVWAILWTAGKTELMPNGLWAAKHGHYTHLWSTGITSYDKNSELATMAMLGNYQIKLSQENCSLINNCLRTWYYMRDIESSYNGMAAGRNSVFRFAGMSPSTHFIASTGISGDNSDSSPLSMDAYAVAGLKVDQVHYLHAPDYLNPTVEYGVAFERGTSIDYGDRRHVLISATASINNRGQIVYPSDVQAQARRITKNVEALLEDADAGWKDVTHIIIYLRDISDYHVIRRYAEEAFGKIPVLIVQARGSRTNCLIQMECSAIMSHEDKRFNNY